MNTPPIDQITLRDFFAAAALTGLLSDGDRKTAVQNAYAIADKMIEERQRDPA
jgi:recombinational DNA repair protein (RecF pathway)